MGGPAGGGYATAMDVLRFARALADGRLLDAHSIKTVLTGKVNYDFPAGKRVRDRILELIMQGM